jgi:DNA polymerase I-like protein with 3'-5' exonuclease and polymerase domains
MNDDERFARHKLDRGAEMDAVSLFKSIAAPYIVPPKADENRGLRLCFDIEADGLLHDATKVHCVVVANLDQDEVNVYSPTEIDVALEHLMQRADYLTGHNICGYDLPLLQRLYSWTPPPNCKILDTLIVSRLVFPDLAGLDDKVGAITKQTLGKLRGRYSLEAWGMRLGVAKIGADIEDWSAWTPEMQERCIGDVAINKALWHLLQPDGYSRHAVELEHRAAAVCDRITADGAPFDVAAARQLEHQWTARRAALKAELVQQFPGVKLTSRKQLAAQLLARGWTPEKYTAKTRQPKIDDELIETLPALYPEFAGLAEFLLLGRRIAALATGKEAWLKHVRADGRIHGSIIPVGTPHSRAKHSKPNLAQVPNTKRGKPFAAECRALFRPDNGWAVVAADQASLQDRGFAHYLHPHDGGAYAEAFTDGVDAHWKTATALGLVSEGTERAKDSALHTTLREGAKTFRYAFLFGAQAVRAGQILYNAARSVQQLDNGGLYRKFFNNTARPTESMLRRIGGKARKDFTDSIPGLGSLKRKLEKHADRYGWLPGLDGRRVPVRALYTALNYLVCSSEAIICKRWLVEVYDELRARFHYGWGYRLAHSFEFKLPDGVVLFVEDRYELTVLNGKLPHKTIRFRHTVNSHTFADTGPRRIVFNWPAIMAAGPGATVFIVEGAYKATPLIGAGLLATAAPYHQWGEESVGALAGRHLVYVEDHDCPDVHGRRKAKELSADAQAKLAPGAASFRTIPALLLWKELGRTDEPPHGWDIRDWMDAGGSSARLRAVCDQVPIPSTSAELESVCLADLEMENYDWLWPDRFALGEIGLLVGMPDVGKGQILAYIASRVTRGLAWPNGEGQAPPGNVVILTSEDNLKKTVYPRFEAAGADCKRIHAIKMVGDINPKTGKPAKRMLSLATDLERLRAKIVAVGNVIAVLIDPVSSYLGLGVVDSYRTSDVRAVLGPLKDLAEEMNAAVIGIMHFNKKVDVTNVLLRVSDSLAFVAAPRHVFGVIYDPENNRTLVVSAKNNLADAEQKRKSLAYHFEVKQVGVDRKGKPIERPFIVWNPGYVDVSATEALSAVSENKAPAALDDAKDFLRSRLAAGGGRAPQAEIEEAAEAEGISNKTLRRAKKALGIKAEKDKTANGQWFWVMPDDEPGRF